MLLLGVRFRRPCSSSTQVESFPAISNLWAILGGSWMVLSGVTSIIGVRSPLIWDETIAALSNRPLVTTHEPK